MESVTRLFIRSLHVTTRTISRYTTTLNTRTSLLAFQSVNVLVDIRRPISWYIECFEEKSTIKLTEGTKISLRRPAILYRYCPGNTSLYIEYRNDIITIKKFSEICTRFVNRGYFCPMHRHGEYSRYISYVFGIEKPRLDISLMRVPHMVYLLHIGGLYTKVGIANALKNTDRLFEQPFLYAMILAFVENGVKARLIEDTLKQLSKVTDRIPLSTRLNRIRDAVNRIDDQLKDFIYVFVRFVREPLRQLIEVKNKVIPVMRLDDDTFNLFLKSDILNEDSITSLEGEFEVYGYTLGGVVLVNRTNKYLYIPYSHIRDRAINCSIKT